MKGEGVIFKRENNVEEGVRETGGGGGRWGEGEWKEGEGMKGRKE